MGRDQNRRGSNSGQDDQNSNWDDWYGQFDPERTRPMRQPPRGDEPGGVDQPQPDEYGYSYNQRGTNRQEQYPWDPPAPPESSGGSYPDTRQQGSSQPPQRGGNYPSGQPDSQRRQRLSDSGGTVPPDYSRQPPRRSTSEQSRSVTPGSRETGGQPQPGQRSISPGGTRKSSAAGKRGLSPRRLVLGFFVISLIAFCSIAAYYIFRLQQVGEDVFVDTGRPTQTVSLTERRNILLMGLDTRSAEDSRSDTMIIVTVDPNGKAAGMLSIPRDLWVEIPDFEGESFGENRINSSYLFGKNSGVENGGPLLAIKTVEHNFQIKIDNFVEVNFGGFRSIVDAMGGVTIDVPRPLIDNEYPADYGFAYQRIYIPAGIQHMDGRTALQYVRSRHADSDLGRNQRQQAVLLAIKEQALQLDIVTRLDDVLKEITGTVKTNLSLEEVVALGNLARDISGDRIVNLAVDANMTTQGNVGGAEVLLPNWPVIRAAVRQMVSDPSLANEAAAIVVHNGTDTPGLATKTGDEIKAEGLNVIGVGNPPDGGGGRYPISIIYDFTSGAKPATIAELRRILGISADNVRPGSAELRPGGADILVMIGDDKAPPATE